MAKLRERIDTNDRLPSEERPTKYKTARNIHKVHCAFCGDVYYVDDHTINAIGAAVKADPSENPFRCDECEEEYSAEEHSH